MTSPKITIIGAGGYVFPFRLIGDLLSFPALRNAQLCLMDINPEKLAPVAEATRKLVAHHGFDTEVVETTDRRAALTGADFVIITFQVGGVESYRRDVEIPRRYGVDQTVGDTVGPGGVFRFLRSVPAYRAIAADALQVCPDARVHQLREPDGDGHRLPERAGPEDRRSVPQRPGHHPDAGPRPSGCRTRRSATSAPGSTTRRGC